MVWAAPLVPGFSDFASVCSGLRPTPWLVGLFAATVSCQPAQPGAAPRNAWTPRPSFRRGSDSEGGPLLRPSYSANVLTARAVHAGWQRSRTVSPAAVRVASDAPRSHRNEGCQPVEPWAISRKLDHGDATNRRLLGRLARGPAAPVATLVWIIFGPSGGSRRVAV